jgi:hypothetical protein
VTKDMLDDFAFHLKKDLAKMEALAQNQGPCFTAKDVSTIIDRIHFRVLSEERRRRNRSGESFCGVAADNLGG